MKNGQILSLLAAGGSGVVCAAGAAIAAATGGGGVPPVAWALGAGALAAAAVGALAGARGWAIDRELARLVSELAHMRAEIGRAHV